MIQKIRLKVKSRADALLRDLSSSPQQPGTAAGNMCLQPNVGTQVLQNIRLPLSSGTIEGTIIQDQASVANVAGMFNNTSLPSSSQYKAVDAIETAMPGNRPDYFTMPESPGSLPSSSQDQAAGNGPSNTSADTDFDNTDWWNDYYMSS